MSFIVIFIISLISYLPAWSFTKSYDVSQYRIMLLAFAILLCLLYYYFSIVKKTRRTFFQEKVWWLFISLLLIVTSVDIKKFYLLIPLIIGFSFASISFEKLIKQLLIAYSLFYIFTIIVSLFIKSSNNGLWGFYHPNIASGYLIGIQILLLLYHNFCSSNNAITYIIIGIIPVINYFTHSSAGLIISVVLSLYFFIGNKYLFTGKPALVMVLSFFPALLNYLIIVFYLMNPADLGSKLNAVLSSRPYIWNMAMQNYSLEFFARQDKILFSDESGNYYEMPIDSLYIYVPLTCGIIFSIIIFGLFIFFNYVISKNYSYKYRSQMECMLFISLSMLLYGLIETHAIEYQVNPLIIFMIVYLYRKFGLNEKNVLY